MLIIFKGKGALVPLFFGLSLIVTGILFYFLAIPFGPVLDRAVFLFFGIMIVIFGAMTWYGGRDSYKNKNGEKVEIDLDNSFFLIKMTSIGKYSLIAGVLLTTYGIFDALFKI